MSMYQYFGCGLDNVFLENGYKIVQTRHGDGVVIHDVAGLHVAIAVAVVSNPSPMIGKEFRFLRQELELSQAALGALLGSNEQAVARWEKGKSKVDPLAERLLRLLYKETTVGNRNFDPVLKMLQQLESVPPQPKRFVAGEKKAKWGVEARTAA